MRTHTPLNELRVGDRVELVAVVDNYPTIWCPVGERGTVAVIDTYSVWVTLDTPYPSLKEWDNQLQVWGEWHGETLRRLDPMDLPPQMTTAAGLISGL